MLSDRLRWTADGTATFLAALATLPDAALDRDLALPGWTGRHLLAHVAANADALVNLATWARTGVETPMYASRCAAVELRVAVEVSAGALDKALSELDAPHWQRRVRTAQGRTVPATQIPWMRAREVMVHAVDLGAGVRFEELPPDFLVALVGDIAAKRTATGDGPALSLTALDHDGGWVVGGHGEQRPVTGTLAGIAAYLAGRRTDGVVGDVALPPWL